MADLPLYAGPSKGIASEGAMASLQSPATSSLVMHNAAGEGIDSTAPESPLPWLTLAGLIILLLLVVEWLMVQRGRWP